MARKSPKHSNSGSHTNTGSRKRRAVHPKRTGIVWGVLVGALTLAGGALVLADGWRGMPAVAVAGVSQANTAIPVTSGKWQAIVIHHSGSAAGTVSDLARQHAAWNLPSLGYHFVIGNGNGETNGSVNYGPRWIAQESGAHVADRVAGATPDAAWFNEHSIGICLIGNGERREFTEAQIAALVDLVTKLQRECGIPDSNVVLHSDLAEVASPGRWFPRARFAMHISG